jgi:lathosterol oxidase
MSLPALLAIPLLITYFAIRSLLVAGGAMLFLARSPMAQVRRVYRRSYAPGQLRSELGAAARVVAFDGVLIGALHASQALPLGRPGPWGTLVQLALLFVWFELWFYVTHRALHTRALYFLHAQHHVAKVTHPLTSLSFGLGERAVLVGGGLGFVVLLGQAWPVGVEAVAGYFLLNYLLNVVGHLNVELFAPGYPRSLRGRIFYSVTFHAMHHARYTGHYGLFTVLPDRLFGTAWEDYPEVQRRAALGDGLTTLGARAQAELTS